MRVILHDPEAMRAAAIAACPDLVGLPVVVHGDGWDSIALAFGGEWMCKFPRVEDGLDALRTEAALLKVVGPKLAIAVPDMTVIDDGAFFTRHRLLPGTALQPTTYLALDVDQRDAIASAVAGFLAELHVIEHDWSAIGIEAEQDKALTADEIEQAVASLAPELRQVALRTLDDHARLGPDPLGEALCYLDAHGGNFAFDPESGVLSGIFDFGDVAVAGPHAEFVEPAYVGRDFAGRVIAAYEAQTGRIIDRARVEALIGAQRLRELAEDGDHPKHGALIRSQAVDWFSAPSLAAPDR